MSNLINVTFVVGAILTLVGSFLPWKQEGDFISVWTYGIQLYPYIKDNGGLLIIFLTILVVILNLRPPDFINRPLIWCIPLSFVLLLISAYHFYLLILNREIAGGVVGAPAIQIGFVLVLVGSILIFVSTLLKYLRSVL